MRATAAAALTAFFVVACAQEPAVGVASSSRASAGRSPSPAMLSTKWNCGDTHNGATAVAIFRLATTTPTVALLDMSNPLKPYLACTLAPANGAHFLSVTKVAFWIGDQLGTADLGSGAIKQTARLAAVASTGAFSVDGTKFAYRSYDAGTGATATHLYVAGSDRTLYVQEPIGGHGGPGPSFGPFDQLEFSPDGSLLLDYMAFRPQSAQPNLIVFRTDGSILFRTNAPGGTWSPTGNTLFFYASDQSGLAGELDSLGATGHRQVVASGLHGMNWPRMSPDGRTIVYNTSDSSVPECGGVPHLWSLDLATGRATQISISISSGPFFVQPTVLWSDEQKLSPCGPGGPSSPDGVILAYDLTTGKDSAVDTTPLVQGMPSISTYYLIDGWFAS